MQTDTSGSYAGHAAANTLASALWRGDRVVLVDASDSAVHVPLGVRALVTGKVCAAPLRTATVFRGGHHVVVRARVLAVAEGALELDTEFEGSTRLPFAACILAIGTSGAGKPALGASLAEYERAMADSAQAIKDADEVLVAGGGPVGTALAGELARAYPTKRLVLVHARSHLGFTARDGQPWQLSARQEAIGTALFGHLCARGVWVHVNERVSADGTALEHVGTPVTGHVAWCTGARPAERTAFLDPEMLGPDGRIAVDDSLRTRMTGVYAAGDCADTEGRKTAAQAVREGTECARLLLAHLAGKEATYTPIDDETFVVPLGPRGGSYPRAVDGYEDGSGAGVVDCGWFGTWDAPEWYLRRTHADDWYASAFRSLFRGRERI